MPTLKIEAPAKAAAGVPPRLIAQYRKYIDRIKPVGVGLIVFSPTEDMKAGAAAIEAAAAQAKVQVAVRKARGQARTLQVRVVKKVAPKKTVTSNKAPTKKTGVKKAATPKNGRRKKAAGPAS